MRDAQKGEAPAREHILVCLSSAPSNARIVSAAARMAHKSGSTLTALFVETPDYSVASSEDKQRLQENRRLAEHLGADVQTVLGEDIAYQIAEFARISEVTTIVLGRSAVSRHRIPGRTTLTDRLIAYVPQMDIHIIPDQGNDPSYRAKKAKRYDVHVILGNILKSGAILLLATLLGIMFDRLGFTESNMIMVYILAVQIVSIVTSNVIYSVISSVVSVFVFNFVFTVPRFSFAAYETGYPVTFVVMCLTAMITGTFSIRYKQQAGQSARIARRTKILFDTGKLLSRANGKEAIFHALAGQIVKLLGRDIVVFDAVDGRLGAPKLYLEKQREEYDVQSELPVAEWVFEHNHMAGATTGIMPKAAYIYFALRVSDRVYGVVGIRAKNDPLDAYENDILLSILGEGALALENEKNAREKEETAILARNEQLRANLLRTISHDLRTPLTTISGNASSLLSSGESFDAETRKQIYTDIYNDSMWLFNLVENLLSSTRIEEGRMNLRMASELLGEIAEEALTHVRAADHVITLNCEDEFLLVRADARLLMQVIVNLVDNAVKYSQPGTEVTVSIRRADGRATVEVADHGPGIPDEEKTMVFEKFYCCANRAGIADNRRSLGLGLYLCRAIIQAHGGTICVKDHVPQGSAFMFSLPLEEVMMDESLSDSCG